MFRRGIGLLARRPVAAGRLGWQPTFALLGGVVAMLLLGTGAGSVTPDAAIAAVVIGLTVPALAIARRIGRASELDEVLIAAGAAQAAQGLFFLLGGATPMVGPLRQMPWLLVGIALFIGAGGLVVLAEVRRWRGPLAVAAAIVTVNNVVLLTGALGAGTWVSVPLYAILAVVVVLALWARVPVTVGSRIIGGFGIVLLAALLLGFGLSTTRDQADELEAVAALESDRRVELAVMSLTIRQIAKVQEQFVYSGEESRFLRSIELGTEVSAAAQRLRKLTVGHPLAADAEQLARFLYDWVGGIGDATTAARQVFLQTGISTDVTDKYRVVTERVLAFEIAERLHRNAVHSHEKERIMTITTLAAAGTTTIFLLAATLAIVLARSIGRRTARLNEAVAAIATGSPGSDRLDLREGGDDLDELTRAFELMRRRLADHAAAEARQRAELESVLTAVTRLAIIATDQHGIITTFSRGAEQMLGRTAAEMVGEHALSPLFHDADELAAAAEQRAVMPPFASRFPVTRMDETVTQRRTYVRKDGSRLPTEILVSARRDERGELVGFLSVARDLTDQNDHEAALVAAKVAAEETGSAKSTFLANMSHELRTPLNAILGFSELMREQEALPPAKRERYLRNITGAGEHLLALIDDALDLSKVESGRLELRPDRTTLAALVLPVVALTRVSAERAGVDFSVAMPELRAVRVDAQRVRQVLLNLLSNAVKFSPRGCQVQLRLRIDERDLIIEVADTGIGIPVERQDRVFGLFERLNEDRSEETGTGLGLALTKRLVELHGGTIAFESTPGSGTTFRIRLPGVAVPSELLLAAS